MQDREELRAEPLPLERGLRLGYPPRGEKQGGGGDPVLSPLTVSRWGES